MTNNRACSNKALILETLKRSTPVFQALGDVNRQQIIALLLEQTSLNVNQITERMAISRPAISHHLKILRQADLIEYNRVGKEKYYSLSSNIRQALQPIKELLLAVEDGP
ncbi:winged helix-turn-helix transcriptional regulator [Brevibacillus sp. SYP-B805]|uniref:ArsR/SmtB family transcription factor n=1 Tax=Brevibacillus sp. SYP-B805 TaxID=1578199 RepID=UPI0013EBF698|nr:metalloregulator ArsR/SmtB family transcription factor [Brevibacillus sp. SYP-B805]NGQ95827.1 winged helix-turn-helix transcriptional regulator [Brevibacillus sp. SYP-B805]